MLKKESIWIKMKKELEEIGIITRCRRCGRKMIGANHGRYLPVDCSDCATDKTNVLHCEKGCKVIVKIIDIGEISKGKYGSKFLHVGDILTVKSVDTRKWPPTVKLKEFPLRRFNTVFFDRYS